MPKYAFDVWYSDGNDRHCIGILAVESEDLESAGWKALDKALEEHTLGNTEWDMPYADPCAVTDIHAECGHHDPEVECDSEDCDCDCYFTESISVEPCENPEEHYYQHPRISLDELETE